MRLLGIACAVVGLIAACGGKSTGTSSSSSSSSGGACTLLACDDGLRMDFTLRGAGTYVVDLQLDGISASCKATLPLPPSPPPPCDRSDVILSLVGSMLPADQQSIGGLLVTKTDMKSIAIRIAKDGVTIASSQLDPVPWVTSPGPNGPGCEPASCTQAHVTVAIGGTPNGFACGGATCDASEYCEKTSSPSGTAYDCVSPSAPAQSASSGGPAPTCSPTDCTCIQGRAMATHCQGGATCTIEGGHAYVSCNPGG